MRTHFRRSSCDGLRTAQEYTIKKTSLGMTLQDLHRQIVALDTTLSTSDQTISDLDIAPYAMRVLTALLPCSNTF